MSERETIAAPSRASAKALDETLDRASAPSSSEAPTVSISQAARLKQASAAGPQRIGRFRIERLLGQGGMGAVYLAYDEQLDRRVALKVPRFDRDDSQAGSEAKERFQREARAAAAVEHPHICPIYDVGESDGRLWLAMAYIEGQPLSRIVAPGKTLRQRDVAQVVRKIALALAAAHAKGVVHRDLKPANIMLAPGKGPVVMDFGLAVRRASGDDRLTRTGIVMGTPAYMSPEQVSGDPDAVGPSSDIYSLGVILFELLAGRPPFLGTLAEMLGHIALSEPPPVGQFRADVDDDLAAICQRAMAKRPAERFSSMKDMAAALDGYVKKLAAPPTHPPAHPTAHPTAPPDLLAAMAEFPTASPPAMSSGAIETQPFAAISTLPAIAAKPSLPILQPSLRRRSAWPAIAGLGALALLVLLGVILLVRTPKGLIQIELSDPKAPVEVQVDGEKVKLSGIGDPLELTVGEHHLLVTGKDFETVSESFTVRKDGNPVLKVSLAPIEAETVAPKVEDEQAASRVASNATPVEPKNRILAPVNTMPVNATPSYTAPSNTAPASTTTWIDINPNDSPSWRWDGKNTTRSYKTYAEGVLTLDNGAVDFPKFNHADAVLKAQVKFLGGQGNAGISLRGHYALISKRNGKAHFAIGCIQKDDSFKDVGSYHRNDIFRDFFEMELSIVGDRAVLRLDGETVISAPIDRQRKHDSAGLNAWGTKASFKNVRIRRQ